MNALLEYFKPLTLTVLLEYIFIRYPDCSIKGYRSVVVHISPNMLALYTGQNAGIIYFYYVTGFGKMRIVHTSV